MDNIQCLKTESHVCGTCFEPQLWGGGDRQIPGAQHSLQASKTVCLNTQGREGTKEMAQQLTDRSQHPYLAARSCSRSSGALFWLLWVPALLRTYSHTIKNTFLKGGGNLRNKSWVVLWLQNTYAHIHI